MVESNNTEQKPQTSDDAPLTRQSTPNGGLRWRRANGKPKTMREVAEEVVAEVKDAAEDVAAKATHIAEDVAAQATHLSDSIFSHMFTTETAANAAVIRRRTMGLIDVLVERHLEGPLKPRWILASTIWVLCYLRYILPMYASWGIRAIENSMEAQEFAETVGGPYSRPNFGVLVLVTLLYLALISFAIRIMETRLPVKRVIFELLVVYNMAQTLMNAYVFVQLLRQAYLLSFQYPWGNQFVYSKESHNLGYFIWFHYHCCQLELIDTLFMVLRKRFRKITNLHICLRLANLWAWYFACRFACGGDAYFPAAVNAGTRASVYAFYSISLLAPRGVPFFRKARVTTLQIAQFAICAMHAAYCLYTFWNMSLPRIVLILYVAVMLFGLVLYTDFHFQQEGKSKTLPNQSRKVSFSFDSSGWHYCYHFGVASWLREHLIPEGLTPEEATTDKFPASLGFSGSSGGSLVAGVLSMGLDPADVFELVLSKQKECALNPFRMLPAVEDVCHRIMPPNAHSAMTGRARIIQTRISPRYPFLTAEVANQFQSKDDVFHALRGSCHVPIIGGMGPYRGKYFDGLFWPQLLVPWKGSVDDCLVRVSAFSAPSSDIKPRLLSPWWALFPPQEEILRGIFWMGYRDAARWFARPAGGRFDLCGCRPSNSTGQSSDDDTSEDESQSTWAEARKLLLRAPREQGQELPELDTRTGTKPAQFIEIATAAIDRERKVVIAIVASAFAIASFLLL